MKKQKKQKLYVITTKDEMYNSWEQVEEKVNEIFISGLGKNELVVVEVKKIYRPKIKFLKQKNL